MSARATASRGVKRERYPLGLCLAAIGMTSLGLCAAAWGIKWGAAVGAGDALRLAWMYVNVMAAVTWFVVWPAMALRVSQKGLPGVAELRWQWAALWVGMVPGVGTAGFLSGVTGVMVVGMVVLQMAMSVFVMGVLAVCGKVGSEGGAVLVGALGMVAVAGPVGVFVGGQFFPRATGAWQEVLPLVAVGRAAAYTDARSALGVGFWGVVVGYGVLGIGGVVLALRAGRTVKA